ncbi:Carboxylesterase family-domain-containing protein [Phaeosphaeria sp. MPI-PUGE-AT-0046c]|nr:Carboxylesterase family-domain-containing protein [Phaeosphaeria sp. MPI-PUGE-AT-0046c]
MYHQTRSTAALCALGIASLTAAAPPHIDGIGTVTILTDNDLLANLTTRTTNALLLTASSFKIAAQRCTLLKEQLFSPSISSYSLGLDNALPYVAYLSTPSNTTQYWIASENATSTSTSCSALTNAGERIQNSCTASLPVLCTNSGPITQSAESFPKPELQVTISAGKQNITGYRDFYTFQFRGIRFSPPVARFEYASVFDGEGSVEALKYGPGCLQGKDLRWPELSEDCQFLNVWTPHLPSSSPEKKEKKLKAVMFWIYGGANLGGTGTDTEKEGGNLASRGDVVVVSFNHRVGNLGYLPFNDGIHNGNYAISDMVAALTWVHKNIEHFGGDPSRITIWGESAGAVNVRALLAVPQIEKMIAGAIMQSGVGETEAGTPAVRYESPIATYETFTKKVLTESGCTNNTSGELACLRAYDASKWWTESGRTQASVAVRDDQFLFTRGLPLSGPLAHPHNIPIMSGYLRDEWSYQVPIPTTNFTQNLAILKLSHLANSSWAPQVSDPKWSSYTTAQKEKAVFDATSILITAYVFKCLPHAFAYSAVKNNVFNAVYEFQFNRTYSPARFDGAARPLCGRDTKDPDHENYYKCHAGDVPYTFGNIAQQGWPDRDGLDAAFARLIVDYWSAFARTGTMAPENGYLEARGYVETKAKMAEAGAWTSVADEAMRLQWTGIASLETKSYKVGCDELEMPEDYYERADFSVDE